MSGERRLLSELYGTAIELHRLLSKSTLRVDWDEDEMAFVRATLGILRELMEMVRRKMG